MFFTGVSLSQCSSHAFRPLLSSCRADTYRNTYMLLQCGCISCLSCAFLFPSSQRSTLAIFSEFVALGVQQVTNGRITRPCIAGHRELSDKLFRAPTFSPSSRQRRGQRCSERGLCQQLLFSLLGKSQETLMHAKAAVPAFFIFSLLGSASSHGFMQRIEKIRDEAGRRGVGSSSAFSHVAVAHSPLIYSV